MTEMRGRNATAIQELAPQKIDRRHGKVTSACRDGLIAFLGRQVLSWISLR
jgi:hypothetical protein